MKPRAALLAGLAASLLIIGTASSLGSSNVGFGDTLKIIAHKIFALPLGESVDPRDVSIVWLLRLPRALLAFLAGGALAASGAVTQSVLRNPLASPYILGVSAGASLGAGIVIVSGAVIPLIGAFTLPLAGFTAGLASMFIVLFFASRVDKTASSNTIILCGMIFSLFVGAALTTLTAVFSDDLRRIILWQMGSFALRGWRYTGLLLPFVIIGTAGILRYTRELDVLTFGDDEAKSAGVETERVRKRLLAFAAALTGAAVALSGVIGFVDLIAPHAARKLAGGSHRYVVPMSFLLGGSLMTITDLAARTLISPSELPVGAITALLGAPFFALVYFRRQRGGRGC